MNDESANKVIATASKSGTKRKAVSIHSAVILEG